MKTLLTTIVLIACASQSTSQQFPTGRPANRPNAQGVSKTWSKVDKPELLRQLRLGGFIIVFRHGATEWAKGDQLPIRDWTDRSKQRQLSERGRQQGREIGEIFKTLRIPVGKVYASPYFRTKDFAELAFGKFEQTTALLDGRRTDFERLFKTVPMKGTNTIFSGHQLPLVNLGYFKTNELEEGSCGVFRPDGKGKVEHIAHMNIGDWKTLESMK